MPKGPSLDPKVKSLAVHVEDHPIEYGTFEGVIPEGEYGGGTVMLWDRGSWEPEGDAEESYHKGKLVFRLHGERLKGRWVLFKMNGKAGADGKNWLLEKLEDDESKSGDEYGALATKTTSIATERTMEEIAENKKAAAKTKKKSAPAHERKAKERADGRVRKPAVRASLDPSRLPGSKRSAMPRQISPELPLLVEDAPKGENWLYELKLDGYRMICFVKQGKASLVTRRGNDWSGRFPNIVRTVESLGLEDAILDGEIVALEKEGASNFQSLQNMLRRGIDDRLHYFVFDLLFFRGRDLRQVSLIDRKRLLSQLLGKDLGSRMVRYNDHIEGRGAEVLSGACGHGLEGVVAKRADSRYVEGRTRDWVKLKCLKRQEFVIGGWTEPGGGRQSLGALLLGYYRAPSELVYCGRVGTGFSQESLGELQQRLAKLERKRSPFCEPLSGVANRGVVHWASPQLVAEVSFSAWTDDGILRHASFQGLREDKRPSEITLELPDSAHSSKKDEPEARPKPTPKPASKTAKPTSKPSQEDVFAGVRITHPDKILYPEDKYTKRDLAWYYESVAEWMLPHVVGRPLSVVRCPEGYSKACFFQKHRTDAMPKAVRAIVVTEASGDAQYLGIDDLSGLISLVQLGVLEIHAWGCREDRIDKPDRLIIDIDPAEDVRWAEVVKAARHAKERLMDLGLESFVRTTGGKGLHVVAPIARRTSWEELKKVAKAFVDALVREQPEHYLAQASKQKRVGKIYLDYLRNQKGATAIASYSTRARRGATVATPLTWQELSVSLDPHRFTIETTPKRLEHKKQDPWKGFFDLEQSLEAGALKTIERW